MRNLFVLCAVMIVVVLLPAPALADGGSGGTQPPPCAKAGQDCRAWDCCEGLTCWYSYADNTETCLRLGGGYPQPVTPGGLFGGLWGTMMRLMLDSLPPSQEASLSPAWLPAQTTACTLD